MDFMRKTGRLEKGRLEKNAGMEGIRSGQPRFTSRLLLLKDGFTGCSFSNRMHPPGVFESEAAIAAGREPPFIKMDGMIRVDPSVRGWEFHRPMTRLHRPALPGRGDKPLRSLRLRVQPYHPPRLILTQRKAPPGFAMRPFPCVTHWFPRKGLTGFTKNDDGRLVMRDAQQHVSYEMNIFRNISCLLFSLFLVGCGGQQETMDALAQRMVKHALTERGKVILDSDEPRKIWSDGAFLEIGESFPGPIEEMLRTPSNLYDISPFILDLQSRNDTEWQDAHFKGSLNSAGLVTVESALSTTTSQIEPLYRDYILARYPNSKLRVKDAVSPILVTMDGVIQASVMPKK